jgi:hypothetical protein
MNFVSAGYSCCILSQAYMTQLMTRQENSQPVPEVWWREVVGWFEHLQGHSFINGYMQKLKNKSTSFETSQIIIVHNFINIKI